MVAVVPMVAMVAIVAIPSASLTGRITTLMAQAAELAIHRKAECIRLDLLDQAASAGIFRHPVEDEADEALASHQQAKPPVQRFENLSL